MRSLIALGLAAALAACGSDTAPVDEALARDLERVGSSSFELAPATSGTQVMSALELDARAPAAAPAPSPRRKPVARVAASRRPQVRAPQPAPRAVERAHVPAEEVVAESAIPAPEPVTAPAPSSAPLGAGPAPPGGWKSIGTVMRNSRVPITP